MAKKKRMFGVKEFLRRKKMPTSFDYVKRFSMCNCLTIPMPHTYTAHAMTIDFFLDAVIPGEKVGVYTIPRKIDTFLFSPFNESTRKAFTIDGVRYTYVGKDMKDAKRVPVMRLTVHEFAERLQAMHRKVVVTWGRGTTRILVLYDNTLADEATRKRADEYDNVAISTLGWLVVRVKDDPDNHKGPWHHYSDAVRLNTLRAIEAVEQER